MMVEHGIEVDHATRNRWVLKYVPLSEREFRTRKQPAGSRWRIDETYVKVEGGGKYLYRAVDQPGARMDVPLIAKRDRKTAPRLLRKAIKGNGTLGNITIGKNVANTEAIESHKAGTKTGIGLVHMIRKGHLRPAGEVRPPRQFYSLAG